MLLESKKYADPLKFANLLWPTVSFYKKQREIIYSVVENDETVVPAGNQLGKDHVSAFIALYFFLTRNPCRIVTTSVKDDHLRVLWGEIGNFISNARFALKRSQGGPLIVNHHDIRKYAFGKYSDKSYLLGMVASEGAAMQGHHLPERPSTLFICDEASGVPDEYYTMASTWAHRMLIVGNPWDCANFFKRAVKGTPGTEDVGGNIPRDNKPGYYRRVIQIKGIDSPNVQYGLNEVAKGLEPSDKVLTPGLLPYSEYVKRRKLWDSIRQSVSIDGEFYEGAEVKMYPQFWLVIAEKVAELRQLRRRKDGLCIGVDTAEGGDSSVWSVVNPDGLLYQLSLKTPNTAIIPGQTIALMNEYGVKPQNVWFDRGGGGKQHVDALREKGYAVKTVAFGEAASDVDKFKIWKSQRDKIQSDESRTIYKNRRAEMYGSLMQLLDPINDGFGLPREYTELRRQLIPIPKIYDGNGVLFLPPKHKDKPDYLGKTKQQTLFELLGCSPDEADSLVIAVFGMLEALAPNPNKVTAIDLGVV